jgi:hypothetical protein
MGQASEPRALDTVAVRCAAESLLLPKLNPVSTKAKFTEREDARKTPSEAKMDLPIPAYLTLNACATSSET